MLRFLLGMLMMSGALIFLGCPRALILRLAGGDWNALVALPGYVAGVWAGVFFLKKATPSDEAGQPPNGYVGFSWLYL